MSRQQKENSYHLAVISMPLYLSTSNVPHAEADAIGGLHGNELWPFGIGAVGDLNYSFALTLLAVDPRNFVLSQIDVRSGTIGSQVGIVDGGDCALLAKHFCERNSIKTYTKIPAW